MAKKAKTSKTVRNIEQRRRELYRVSNRIGDLQDKLSACVNQLPYVLTASHDPDVRITYDTAKASCRLLIQAMGLLDIVDNQLERVKQREIDRLEEVKAESMKPVA